MKVVCLKDNWTIVWHGIITDAVHPRKGEIYNAIHAGNGYLLIEGFVSGYDALAFRPVDHTYGEVICKILAEQIEFENNCL